MYDVILDQVISLADAAKRWGMSDTELDTFIEDHHLQVFQACKEPRVIFPRKDSGPIPDCHTTYRYRCTPHASIWLVGSKFYQGEKMFLDVHIAARYEKELNLAPDQEPLISPPAEIKAPAPTAMPAANGSDHAKGKWREIVGKNTSGTLTTWRQHILEYEKWPQKFGQAYK